MALDLDKALADIVANSSVSNASLYKPDPTDTSPSLRSVQLQSVFEQAYPDQQFDVIQDTDQRVTIRSRQRERKNVPAEVTVPKGFSIELAQKGVEDLQAALEKATTDQDKLNIALRLQAMVSTTKAYRFSEYKSRAEAEYGIPDIVVAIERVKQAEMSNPNNPNTGMPSRERMELLQSLGSARTSAAGRIQMLMATDSSLAMAENLAEATIRQLQLSTQLEGRNAIRDARDQKKFEREVAISSLDPHFVQGMSIVRFNNARPSDEQRQQIAGQYVDGKLRLTETEKALATADTESLQSLYVGFKDPKDRELTLRMLQAREEAIVGDPKQAKVHVDLFKKVFDRDISGANEFPELQRRWKQRTSEITAQFAGNKKESDAETIRSRIGFQREMLGEVVKQAFYNDIREWKGLMQSDEVAKAIFLKNKDKKDFNVKQFIDEYLYYNDGRRFDQKSQAIQAIVTSAIESYPRSAVLPIPSAESMLLDIQRQLARNQLGVMMKQSGIVFSSLGGH